MAPKDFKYETYWKSMDSIKSWFNKLEASVTQHTSSSAPLTPVETRKLNTIFSELKKKCLGFYLNLQSIIEAGSGEADQTVLSTNVDKINYLYVNISISIETNSAMNPPCKSFG